MKETGKKRMKEGGRRKEDRKEIQLVGKRKENTQNYCVS